MSEQKGFSPLLEKYQEIYTKDPASRVFAPLAECYRKIGLVDKALVILKNGIRHHPESIQGYIGLAYCYVDKEEFQLAYNTLNPLVSNNRDNLRLLKIYAEICDHLFYFDESLQTYKYLLFLNPKNFQFAEKVQQLEQKNSLDSKINSNRENNSNYDDFRIENITTFPERNRESLDNWEKVNLNKEEKEEKSEISDEKYIEENLGPQSEKEKKEIAIITHTLIDLYIKQGYYTKAKTITEQMLEDNPNDEVCLKKLEELKKLEADSKIDKTEDDGRKKLMSLFDDKIGAAKRVNGAVVTEKLNNFLASIQLRAQTKKEQNI